MTAIITQRKHFPLIVLGFTTSIVQVIILREFVSVFYSNELIFGIVLSVWMALIALGAWFGVGKTLTIFPNRLLFILFFLSGILPLLLVFILHYFRNFLSQPGVLISMWQLLPIIVFVLMPVCLLAGIIFTILSKPIPGEVGSNGAKLYGFETIGSIIGGLTVSLVMVLWLNSTQSLAIIFAANIATASIYFINRKRIIKVLIILASVLITMLFFIFNVDLIINQFLYNNQKILETHETPYGNVTITETSGQINVFENMALQFTTESTIANEETAHFPMLQHNNPERVLLISGGISGIAKEILKYNSVKELVYIEPNPWLVHYTTKYIKLPEDKRLKVIYRDGRHFLVSDTSRYDVIIIALPEPGTLQLNRYYSSEFIKILKKHSAKKSIISFSLNSYSDYLSHENRLVHSVLFNTLKTEFQNVIVLPGEKDYLLASDNILTSEIGRLSDMRKIKNKFVNSGYINDRSLNEESQSIRKNIIPDAPINADFKPVATSVQSSLFFSRFKINSFGLIIAIVLLLLVPATRLNSFSFSMYITGFTASALEMIILMAFQIMFGYLYAASGLIFAVFMAGLAFGSLISPMLFKKFTSKYIKYNQILMTFIIFIVPIFLTILNKLQSGSLTYLVIFMLIFTIANITGFQFSIILKYQGNAKTGSTGYLYGVDLFGSALGLLLISALFLPILGLAATTAVLIVLNIIAISILYLTKQKHY